MKVLFRAVKADKTGVCSLSGTVSTANPQENDSSLLLLLKIINILRRISNLISHSRCQHSLVHTYNKHTLCTINVIMNIRKKYRSNKNMTSDIFHDRYAVNRKQVKSEPNYRMNF